MSLSDKWRFPPGVRWFHKWIGVAIGLLMFAWLASGILLVLPETSVANGEGIRSAPVGAATVAITPGRAAALAFDSADATTQIRRIGLERVFDTLVFVVQPMRGAPVMVHATTGARFVISSAHALAVVSALHPGETPSLVERLTKGTQRYRGPLPAHHMLLDDTGETEIFIAEGTGEMKRTQRRDRLLRKYGHNVHVLSMLATFPGGQTTRKFAMLGGGVLAIVIVTSGYWLSLPRRLLRRRR